MSAEGDALAAAAARAPASAREPFTAAAEALTAAELTATAAASAVAADAAAVSALETALAAAEAVTLPTWSAFPLPSLFGTAASSDDVRQRYVATERLRAVGLLVRWTAQDLSHAALWRWTLAPLDTERANVTLALGGVDLGTVQLTRGRDDAEIAGVGPVVIPHGATLAPAVVQTVDTASASRAAVLALWTWRERAAAAELRRLRTPATIARADVLSRLAADAFSRIDGGGAEQRASTLATANAALARARARAAALAALYPP